MKLALKIPALLLGSLLFTSTNIVACELHGGFGFGSFGSFHPLAKQHMLMPEPDDIELVYDKNINVVNDAQTKIQLSYAIPNEYSNVEVTLIASEEIILSNASPLSLPKNRGSMNLEFSATGSGQHSIVVRIDATQNHAPYSKVQRINVTSG